jgi:hypothetical protein
MHESPYQSPMSGPAADTIYGSAKFLALWAVLLFALRFIAAIFLADKFAAWSSLPLVRIATIVIVVAGLCGTVFFIVDACRREYISPREFPIALAIVGPFSFGVGTLVYYCLWGWRDLRARYSATFCEDCLRETEEYDGALDLCTINYVNGGRLFGNAKKCATCGSTVKTHCFYLFGIPLFSRGSFRVQYPEMAKCIVRKARFHWPHLLNLATIPAVLLALAVMIFMARR